MPIRILPDEVASQIAAGEVVERPASVVKELVENSLDAHAQQITIRIDKGGRTLMEIADDGDGISAQELTLAVTRHATSKLRSAADLSSIATLGFRGEALASIASVSRMTVTSRPRLAEVGARIRVDGGKVGELSQLGVPAGTVVSVEDLFYCVPARLKFLKQEATEKRRINALVTRYALAYADVRWKLVEDGRTVLQTTGRGDRREVLANLYGVDMARQMLEIQLEDANFKISGFVSPIELTRTNRSEITFFINGRWIQDIALTSALMQAYRTLIMVGRYPTAVLFIEMDPQEVDVNVHPAKAEVRFRKPQEVYGLVQRAVRRGLLAYEPLPEPQSPNWQGGYQPPQTYTQRTIDPAFAMSADTDLSEFDRGLAQQVEPPAQAQLPGSDFPLLRVVGQVGASYVVAEGPDGLYLIDQRAAHERVLYERLLDGRGNGLPGQRLLEPAVFTLPPQLAPLLSEKLGLLGELGFEVEEFGPNDFRINALPVLLMGSDPVGAVRSLVEDFEGDEAPLQAQQDEALIARISRRAAVKAGQALTSEEQVKLVRDLEACRDPRSDPRGRPTMIHLSVDLLERQFGRRSSR